MDISSPVSPFRVTLRKWKLSGVSLLIEHHLEWQIAVPNTSIPFIVQHGSGGTLATSVMNMIIESSLALPRPVGLLLVYPCMQVGLDFWINNDDLAVVEEEVARGPIPSDSLKARPGRGDGMTLNSKAAFLDDQILGSSFVSFTLFLLIL